MTTTMSTNRTTAMNPTEWGYCYPAFFFVAGCKSAAIVIMDNGSDGMVYFQNKMPHLINYKRNHVFIKLIHCE